MSRGRNGAGGGAKGARKATGAAQPVGGGGKGRWSARRKMTVVLELLRDAELEATNIYRCCRLMPSLGRLAERGLIVEDSAGSSDLRGGCTNTSFP